MLPINLLGDAAAAEEMVKQATRNARPDRITQNDLFERQLQLSIEKSRLASVRPASAVNGIDPIHAGNNGQSRKKKHHRFHAEAVSIFRDQPPVIHENIQPLLFEIHADLAVDEYHKTDAEPEMGHILDRKG
jgi:hypothetical protein